MKLLPRKWLVALIQSRNQFFIPFVLFYIFTTSYIALQLEPKTFKNYLNSVWWVMTTLTTVGFGDFSPATPAGKLFGIFLYITGIGLMGVVIGKVLNSVTAIQKLREEGNMQFTGKNHLIIIGWSVKSELAIREILHSEPAVEIVLVANLAKAPLLNERIHYVRGQATDEQTLMAANITHAKGVIIFASYVQNDAHISDPILLDGKTLLVATAVTAIEKKYNARIHVTVEVISKHHITMFKHVRVDEFIPSYEMISNVAVRSLFTHGVTDIYTELIRSRYGENETIYEVKTRTHWYTYRDAFLELLDEGATLIADGSDLYINQKLSEPIPKGAKLYVICDQQTYQKMQ